MRLSLWFYVFNFCFGWYGSFNVSVHCVRWITSFLISHFPRFVVQRAVMVWTCDRDFDTDAARLLCILAVIVGNCSLRCVSSFHFISVTVPCFLVVMCTWRSSSSSSLRRCCRCAVDLIHAACLNVWLFALYIRLYRLVFSWA